MAITSTTYPNEQQKQGTSGTSTKPQQQSSYTYKPSDQVTQAQQKMQQVQAQKPQGYDSKYGEQLESILQQIQNPKEFKYSFDGDELFKMYADQYTQKGKQASMDAMGQAAALTGGYGNSYAQQAGNQAYDQYLLSLYDKGLDLHDRAYQKYQDQRADVYNQYGALSQADQTDYGRYRDTVGDWNDELKYYTDMYNDEYNRDYTIYNDQRTFDEQVRQFNENLNWEKMSQQQKYAAEYAMQILANGQMPSEELLMQAGLSANDAQLMMAQLVTAAGGGGGGGKGGDKDTTPTTGGNTSNKPKSLLGAQHGAETALINQKTLTATTPAGPINTSVKPAATTTNTKKQTAEEILKNGFTDNYKRYTTLKK